MKLKHLESFIQAHCTTIDFNKEPNIELEQYSTPIRLAAELAIAIDQTEELEGKTVSDFGCGCGILTAALLPFDPDYILSIDLDPNCLLITQGNLSSYASTINLLQADVVSGIPIKDSALDIVVTNPPFGTRSAHADIAFVQEALRVAPVVYSFHKQCTRKFIQKAAQHERAGAEILCSLSFELPKLYSCHRKSVGSTLVDIWRFSKEI